LGGPLDQNPNLLPIISDLKAHWFLSFSHTHLSLHIICIFYSRFIAFLSLQLPSSPSRHSWLLHCGFTLFRFWFNIFSSSNSKSVCLCRWVGGGLDNFTDERNPCRKDINKEREEVIVFVKEFLDYLRRTQWDFTEAEEVVIIIPCLSSLPDGIICFVVNSFLPGPLSQGPSTKDTSQLSSFFDTSLFTALHTCHLLGSRDDAP
jgi:hypothetical protein